MLIVLLIAGITLLHFCTSQSHYYFHVFYGELYFLPIILAAFRGGLREALFASATVTICYLPFVVWNWQGFSPDDLDSILSILLYNGLAVLLGILKGNMTRAQEELLKTKNLAVMGRSLAAAAHDMRTPLVVIGGLARRLLKKKYEDPACVQLELIIKETDKMEKMIGDMLDFSKPLTLTPEQRDFCSTVQASLLKTREVARRHNVFIKHQFDPEAEMLDIRFDSLRVEQVIVNLVLNAIEASSEGDTVTIVFSLTSPGSAVLDVMDNGSGIPLARREKVFDPFFTTKKEGTGLRLPIVHKIIKAHGWSLQIMDRTGGGTVFRIGLTENEYSC